MDEVKKIERLEERLAWLERHVVEQDKVMLEMADDIARLKRELLVQRDRLASAVQGEQGAPADERPPHY